MSETREFGPFQRDTTVVDNARLTIELRGGSMAEKHGALHAYLPHDCDDWTIGEGDEVELIARLTELRDSIDEALAWLAHRAT